MKRVLAVLIVLALCGVGFGFYRGWFALSSPSPSEGSNEVNVNLATDTDKIKEDAQTVKDKAAELTGNVTDGSAESANPPEGEVERRQDSLDEGHIDGDGPDGIAVDE